MGCVQMGGLGLPSVSVCRRVLRFGHWLLSRPLRSGPHRDLCPWYEVASTCERAVRHFGIDISMCMYTTDDDRD